MSNTTQAVLSTCYYKTHVFANLYLSHFSSYLKMTTIEMTVIFCGQNREMSLHRSVTVRVYVVNQYNTPITKKKQSLGFWFSYKHRHVKTFTNSDYTKK